MSALLLGLGTSRPAHSMTQTAAAEIAIGCCCTTDHQARLLRRLYGRTTIRSRGISLAENGRDAAEAMQAFYPPAGNTTPPGGPTTARRMQRYRELVPTLATPACVEAIRDSGVDAGAITNLVVVTCTGFASPGLESALIARLGLDPGVRRTSIGFMGCHGALNGLQSAAAITRADPAARVLVCAAELCSLHFQYGWDAERLVANALFADGAAAAVVGSARASHGGTPWRIADTASRLIEGTEDEMSWHIGDHGFVMTLSAHVPQVITTHLRPWLDDWLHGHGLAVDDVGSWAIHAGGPRIVEVVLACTGVAEPGGADSRDVLRECGNMSSATLLFILERLRRRGGPLPCVALGFGPGLVAEAMLLVEE